MAKLKNDPISKPDLLDYLNSYSDFSFELKVLKMLREQGLECEHGGHYEDPVTNKSREFDIRVKKTIEKFRIRMAIECKNIRENFPVLISCVPRQPRESFHQIAFVSEPEDRITGFVVPRAKMLSIKGQHSLYKPLAPVGKSIVQVGRGTDNAITANDNELYEKWGQSLSSIDELIKSLYWDGNRHDSSDNLQSAVFPFVVVPNNRLWIVSYDENGNLTCDPTPTNRCPCFINKEYRLGTAQTRTSMLVSHVEIVTYDGLLWFIQEYVTTKTGMAEVFSKEGIAAAYSEVKG